jgi:cobalt transporter subunit CbtB
MTMKDQIATAATLRTASISTSLSSPMFQIAATFMLGMVMLFGVGFVDMSAVHTAAHDMRHAAGFPCH